jgi:beta-phosphoglucomutase-like phosphatase (HAD superfamily)
MVNDSMDDGPGCMTVGFPFAAVIFDCDSVLVASERLINDLEAGLLSQLGLSLSPADTRARFKGHTVAEVVAIVETLLRERLPADWLYEWGMRTALGFAGDLQAVPGVRGVLDWLASRAIPLGVAS